MVSRFVNISTCFITLCFLMILTTQEMQKYPPRLWQRLNQHYENQNLKQGYNLPLVSSKLPFPSHNPIPAPMSSNTIWDSRRVSNFFLQKAYENGQYVPQMNNGLSKINNNMQNTRPMTAESPKILQETISSEQWQRYLPKKEKSKPFYENIRSNKEMIKLQQVHENLSKIPTPVLSFSMNQTKRLLDFGNQLNSTCQGNCEADSRNILNSTEETVHRDESSDGRIKGIQHAENVSQEMSQTRSPIQQRGPLKNPDKSNRKTEKNYTKTEHEHLDRIVFPDEVEQLKESKYDMDPASVCNHNGSTFCLNATYYPEDLVNLAIQRNDSIKLMENSDEISDISVRISDGIEEPLCRSYTQVVYPRSAETLKRNWLFVVNQDNFKQGIRVEVCVEEDLPCDSLDDILPEGYKVFCKQNYIYRELVAVTAYGTISKEVFKFPSSCCCHKELADVFVNFGK